MYREQGRNQAELQKQGGGEGNQIQLASQLNPAFAKETLGHSACSIKEEAWHGWCPLLYLV